MLRFMALLTTNETRRRLGKTEKTLELLPPELDRQRVVTSERFIPDVSDAIGRLAILPSDHWLDWSPAMVAGNMMGV